jgi:predicted amidohydrolase YtcJ
MDNLYKADFILKGAAFFCGKGLDQDIDFLAVKGNKIVAVGKENEIQRYVGDDTILKTYTKNNLIMPGFYDSHTHIISAGMADK